MDWISGRYPRKAEHIEEHGGFCGMEAGCQGNLHLFRAGT